MMNLEKMFYKWYKKVSIDMPQEQVQNRWDGIQDAAGKFNEIEKIAELIKIYLRLSSDHEIMESFISSFSEIDKGFDESNEEEISILVGSVLAHLLQGDFGIFTALSLQILEPYYGCSLKELQELADIQVMELMKEEHRIKRNEILEFEQLPPQWADRISTENISIEEISEILVNAIDIMVRNQQMLYAENRGLYEENRIYQEEIQILSWMIGEASDILESPLSEVEIINGAMVLGVELADLVKKHPGPYAADAFLRKMLSKCKGSTSEVSLTGFIDSQKVQVKEVVVGKYGGKSEKRNLPILSAINASLTVDKKKEWLPAYRKAWKMDPDKVKMPLERWAKLIYQECLISQC